jgi:hypothetical protein
MAITPTINAGDTAVIGNVWRVVGTLDSISTTEDDLTLIPTSGHIKSMRIHSSLSGRPQAFSIKLNTDTSGTKNGTCRIKASDQTETTVDFEATFVM